MFPLQRFSIESHAAVDTCTEVEKLELKNGNKFIVANQRHKLWTLRNQLYLTINREVNIPNYIKTYKNVVISELSTVTINVQTLYESFILGTISKNVK